jgi:hypothetical protein
MLVIAFGTDVKMFRAGPIVPIFTFFADKAICSFYLKQIFVTVAWIRKAQIEFNFGFWKILSNGEIFNTGLVC